MAPTGKNTGSNTSSMLYSPSRRKRMKQRAKAQEARWARMAGPVITRNIRDEETK